MKISAIIPAAGKGKRLRVYIPKPYISILGKPLLFYTLSVFEKARYIDEIICAVRRDDIEYCAKNVIRKFNFKKIKLVAGGETRFQSVKNSLEAVSRDAKLIVIHDAARPFLKEGLLKRAIEKAKKFGASCVALPLTDTVKIADKNLNIIQTPERRTLWKAQTPQCFEARLIKSAYTKAAKAKRLFTDDASVVEATRNKKIKIVEGVPENIKITTKEDIILAEMMMRRKACS